MVTILGGLFVGLSFVKAAEFSFLLALPSLRGATVYETMSNIETIFSHGNLSVMGIGILTSMVVAAIAMKALVRWLTPHGMAAFGWYRLALATFAITWICLTVKPLQNF